MGKDQWSSIGFSIFSIVLIYESLKLPVWREGTPMVGLFPLIVGLLLFISSPLHFLKGRSKKIMTNINDSFSQRSDESQSVVETSETDWKKVLLSMGTIVMYPFLFKSTGYLISTTIFLFIMYKVVEGGKILETIAVIIGTILITYLIFGYFLGVPFP